MRSALLSRGFLPKELPPPFSSESFGAAYGNIATPSVMSSTAPKQTSPVCHNLPRVGLLRRPLAIPDPIRFLLLVDSIIDAWPQLQGLYAGSNLSLTRPRRDHQGNRAFTFRIGFPRHSDFRARVRAGARYILQADISHFYPSLYTHAIPWAIHGKIFAKSNRGSKHIGNVLDKRVRDGQDGQTKGVPIGPESSFLIAEALLSSLDGPLRVSLSNRPGLRITDEYEFAFESYTSAEEGLAILQEQLSEFELSLNPQKTRIVECPIPLNPPWLTALQSVPLPERGTISRRLLVTYIDRAFELTAENRGEAILNWMLSRLMFINYSRDQWRITEPLVLQAASEPGALPRSLRLLLNARVAGLPINRSRLLSTLSVVTSNAIRRGHGSEAAWGVWGHILFDLRLDSSVTSALATIKEDIVALVALDARNRGLIPGGTTFPLWEANVCPDGLRDSHWLLAYEATVKRWLTVGPSPFASNRAFRDLAAKNVSFYTVADPEVLTQKHVHSMPLWRAPSIPYLI
jgi:hypothetical protein